MDFQKGLLAREKINLDYVVHQGRKIVGEYEGFSIDWIALKGHDKTVNEELFKLAKNLC